MLLVTALLVLVTPTLDIFSLINIINKKICRTLFQSTALINKLQTEIPKTSLDELDKVERHLNQGAPFLDWLGIRVYEPERMEGEVVWHLRQNPPAKLTNILTIGIYEGHAFVIKDILKLARTYTCVHCSGRFTQAFNLQRHAERCTQGKTVIDYPAERVEAPQTSFEKAFYPKHQASHESLRWLE